LRRPRPTQGCRADGDDDVDDDDDGDDDGLYLLLLNGMDKWNGQMEWTNHDINV
jgi:hypothetical protein